MKKLVKPKGEEESIKEVQAFEALEECTRCGIIKIYGEDEEEEILF